MTILQQARAMLGRPAAVQQPGPVTLAIRGVRPNSLPSWEMREQQIEDERRALRELRERIAGRIEADLALLDAIDGDPDLETDDAEDEETLGWGNSTQILLPPNTADGDATALETHGQGFIRSGHEDDEDTHDREALDEDGDASDEEPDDSGIGDQDGLFEQIGAFSPFWEIGA